MSLLERLQAALRVPAMRNSEPRGENALPIAAAVLLLELEHADHEHNPAERAQIERELQAHFRLSEEEAHALVQEAEAEARHAVSLHDYVTVINNELDAADKLHILRMLWQVAYADDHLHHYEEHLLRQLADLLHIPHHDYVRIKLQVSGEL